MHGRLKALSALPAKGAPHDLKTYLECTALTAAVAHSQPESRYEFAEVMDILMPYFDITTLLSPGASNALQLAASGGHYGIVRTLLEKGEFDLSYRDIDGKTAMNYAKNVRPPCPENVLEKLNPEAGS
ncbi:hypothetical protein BDW74DRAFT_178048 [Aspergillus multicolor]|uniref:uncharacterized protein n=1 Tax=Aspergillus multicolor TaxID=41759 RepID=UPI003CCDBC95